MSRTPPQITVVGSINMDLVVRTVLLSQPGQTVLADSSHEICGGKGANQAVAAARAGGNVRMVGRVGDDGFARRLTANLQDCGINTDHVASTADVASGLAIVAVDQAGQNSIYVVPNSNGQVDVADVEAARDVIESSSILLVQLEIPIPAVQAAIKIAQHAGVRTIVDPAPAPQNWDDCLFGADLLCPNESEAAAFAGIAVECEESAREAAQRFCDRGAKNVAITLGDRGTLLFDGQCGTLIEPFPVEAVDSTAAGDAFAGALAVHWAEHNDLVQAVRFGNAAGALSASREGAQPSMAKRCEIEKLWSTT